MRATLPLLLFSSILPAAHGAVAGPNPAWRRQNSDEEVIAAYADSGHCLYYLEKPNRERSLAPCKIFCEKEGSDSYGCMGPDIPDEYMDSMPKYDDEDGGVWVQGTCKCEFPIAEVIAEIVIEALEKLPNVLCAVALESVKLIVDVGSNFIPGVAPAKTATRLAIEAAKTIAENGLPAEDFSSWVGETCNLDDWDFDPVDAFIPLSNMPDSLGTSIGCLRKDKKKCKKLDPKPDPKPTDKKPDDDGPKPSDRNGDDDKPNPTATKSADSPSDTSCSKKGDCGVECSNVDVWGDELPVTAEPDNMLSLPLDAFGLGPRGILEKRDKKNIRVCGLAAQTENFHSGKKMANSPKLAGMNNIYALSQPRRCDNFDFGQYPVSLYTSKYAILKGRDRLESEHVLEAQMVDIFFQHVSSSLGPAFDDPFDPTGQNKVDFCTYIEAYWADGYGNPLPDLTGSGTGMPAAKWLADQYPTNKNWVEEFLLLPGTINQLKEKAWNTRDSVVVDPKPIERQLRSTDFKQKSIEQSDTLKAILKYRDMISLYKYHTDSYVHDILKKQSNRIADTLDKLEDTIAGLDFSKRQPPIVRPYKKWGLKQTWEGWIPGHIDNTISKINKFFDGSRDDYIKAKARMQAELKKDPKMPRDLQAKYNKVIGLIDTCEDKYKKMQTFANPFPRAKPSNTPTPDPDSDSDTDMEDV